VGRVVPGEEIVMRCTICRQGETAPGTATVTLERGATTVVIRGVPAEVCPVCGEYYLGEGVAATALARAEEAVSRGAEVEILRWVA
jgi:YgiT-type zinc finger domain-containing protein